MERLTQFQKHEIVQQACAGLIVQKAQSNGLRAALESMCKPAACHALYCAMTLFDLPFCESMYKPLPLHEKVEMAKVFLIGLKEPMDEEHYGARLHWALEIIEDIQPHLSGDALKLAQLLQAAFLSCVEGDSSLGDYLAYGAELLQGMLSKR